MLIKPFSLKKIIEKLDKNVQFAMSRWGDGEWHAVLKTSLTENCDGHKIDTSVGDSLRRILAEKKPYHHCLLQIALETHAGKVEEYCSQIVPELQWFEGDQILDSSLAGELLPFIKAFRRYKIMYVGPLHVQKAIEMFFDPEFFVQTPEKNAYFDRIRVETQTAYFMQTGKINMIGFSCGFLSKVLIDNLWELAKQRHISMIDFGSMWDPYVGINSRSYSRGRDWNYLARVNGAI